MLDSQHIDSTAREKTEILLKENESVFIWPKELGLEYKDVNEYCIASKVDELPTDYVLKNTVTGIEGILQYKFRQIKWKNDLELSFNKLLRIIRQENMTMPSFFFPALYLADEGLEKFNL